MSKSKTSKEKSTLDTAKSAIAGDVQKNEKNGGAKTAPSKQPTSLIDMVMQSQKKAIPERKKPNESHAIALKAMESLAPKRFVHKKKSKKLSSVKRRILNERLKIYLEDQLRREILFDKSDQRGASVRIYNFCNGIDWADQDEIQEYSNNILELLSSIECISRISFWRKKLQGNEDCFVEVEFSSKTLADVAVNMLEGLNLGGDILKAILHCRDDTSKSTVDASSTTDVAEESSSGRENISDQCILVVENLVSKEDFADTEELEEILQDIYNLCLPFAKINSLWVEQNTIPVPVKMVDVHDKWTNQLPTISNQLISITLSSFDVAYEIMKMLNRREIGGQQLSCYFYNPVYRNVSFQPQHICRMLYSHVYKEPIDDGYDQQIYFALVIKQFTTIESLQDEDEKMEILSNLQDIVLGCNEDETIVFYNEVFFVRPSSSSDAADAYLLWKMEVPMIRVYQALQSKVIGGNELLMELKTVNIHVLELSQETVSPLLLEEEVKPYTNTIMSSILAYNSPETVSIYSECTLLIDHYVTEEDIQDAGNDKQLIQDTIKMFKEDLLHIIRDFEPMKGKPLHSFITQIKYMPMISSSKSSASSAAIPAESSDSCAVCIQVGNWETTQRALLTFDGLTIGGGVLSAYIHPRWLHSGDHYEEQILLKEEFCQQILLLQQQHQVQNQSSLDMTGYECMHSMIPPQQQLQAEPEIMSMDEIDPVVLEANQKSILINLRKKYYEEHDAKKVNPRLSKYKLAKEIPRLGKHQTPSLPIPVASEEINVIIKEFLRLISTFQARNKEKFSAIKYKLKLRFVVGMKQVLKAIKTKHVRIVFVAPNTDVSEEIDEKLVEIITEAQQRDMDIMYCLSKRLLGKALQMSMKQSVVAVLDPDGAYELYRKVSSFIRTYPKPKLSTTSPNENP